MTVKEEFNKVAWEYLEKFHLQWYEFPDISKPDYSEEDCIALFKMAIARGKPLRLSECIDTTGMSEERIVQRDYMEMFHEDYPPPRKMMQGTKDYIEMVKRAVERGTPSRMTTIRNATSFIPKRKNAKRNNQPRASSREARRFFHAKNRRKL